MSAPILPPETKNPTFEIRFQGDEFVLIQSVGERKVVFHSKWLRQNIPTSLRLKNLPELNPEWN